MDDPTRRAERTRGLQRGRPEESAIVRRVSPWHQGRDDLRGDVHLGRYGFSDRARSACLSRDACLAARARQESRLRAVRYFARAGVRHYFPSVGRDDARYFGLLSPADAGTSGNAQGGVDRGAGEGSTRGMAQAGDRVGKERTAQLRAAQTDQLRTLMIPQLTNGATDQRRRPSVARSVTGAPVTRAPVTRAVNQSRR